MGKVDFGKGPLVDFITSEFILLPPVFDFEEKSLDPFSLHFSNVWNNIERHKSTEIVIGRKIESSTLSFF